MLFALVNAPYLNLYGNIMYFSKVQTFTALWFTLRITICIIFYFYLVKHLFTIGFEVQIIVQIVQIIPTLTSKLFVFVLKLYCEGLLFMQSNRIIIYASICEGLLFMQSYLRAYNLCRVLLKGL